MCAKNPRHIQLVFKKRPTSDIERGQSRPKKSLRSASACVKPRLIPNIRSEVVEISLLMNCKTID